MKKMLVTGGAGFIGSHFIKRVLSLRKDIEIINLDKLTYAGNLGNLEETRKNQNYRFIRGDICDANTVKSAIKGCDTVLNFAAESHVDKSIHDPNSFIKTNIVGTFVLLEEARKQGIEKFAHISTDEVYGSKKKDFAKEGDPLAPANPYSASKAAADLLALSYFKTYGLGVNITRSSNNFGPFQHPEKLIPLVITNFLEGKKAPLYGDGSNERDWLFVEDNCQGIWLVLKKGKKGEVYNIGGENRHKNIDVTKKIIRILGLKNDLIEFVGDRQGHDKRYALRFEKIKSLGFTPSKKFDEKLKTTINWYKNNAWWWKPLKKGDFDG